MKSLHGRTELKPYALLIRADLVHIQRPAQHLLVCLLRVLPSLNRARNNFRVHFLGASCPSELKCSRRLWCQRYLTRTYFELPCWGSLFFPQRPTSPCFCVNTVKRVIINATRRIVFSMIICVICVKYM